MYYQNNIRKSTITNCRPATHGTVKKSYMTFTVTRHPNDNKSKATGSLFLVKIIAKLERTLGNAYQNKDKHRTPTKKGTYKSKTG